MAINSNQASNHGGAAMRRHDFLVGEGRKLSHFLKNVAIISGFAKNEAKFRRDG
ncbi:hypothetical protein [Herbaspirillum sp. meg3]|uniref:hypothetical protein n=1 Tax=Herbaspirillum sp. meg3 TaxID=2025949 RepID=UPI0012FD4530|nr:hypothetical protein [Herbaspirillum sp. meg3]